MASAEAGVQKIREHYDKALQCLKTGLQWDEKGDKAQALVMYRHGRKHLVDGLEVNARGDFARQMQLKMSKSLSTIRTRVTALESETPTQGQRLYPTLPVPQPLHNTRRHLPSPGGAPALAVPGEHPPAYTPQPTEGHLSISHGGPCQPVAPVNLREAGMEVLFLPGGVQVFFVSAEGHVSAPSYPGFLRVTLHRNQNAHGGANYAPAYLQVTVFPKDGFYAMELGLGNDESHPE